MTNKTYEDGVEMPIDFSWFDETTGGDRALQKEVLDLFLMQLPQYLEGLHTDDPEEGKAAAHRLRGASQSIGAKSLAAMAKALEYETYDGTKNDVIAAILKEADRLSDAITAFQV